MVASWVPNFPPWTISFHNVYESTWAFAIRQPQVWLQSSSSSVMRPSVLQSLSTKWTCPGQRRYRLWSLGSWEIADLLYRVGSPCLCQAFRPQAEQRRDRKAYPLTQLVPYYLRVQRQTLVTASRTALEIWATFRQLDCHRLWRSYSQGIGQSVSK